MFSVLELPNILLFIHITITIFQLKTLTGKNVVAVKQDFYANIFTRNLTSILAFPVHDKIDQKYKHRKLNYKINWTQAIAKMRNGDEIKKQEKTDA